MESIDWSNLSFGYMPTDYNVRCIYKDGKWGDITVTSSQTFEIHMAATCLHYGQEAFEGMKAFRGKDGKIRIFRMDENAARLQSSCRGIMMPELPTEKFNEAILTVVKKNERFVPPYESGASLYIRPLLIGTSAQVGVKPAKEYLFIVFVSPVGPYFKEGFKPTPMAILRQYDRAVLYLDAKEKKYIDECGPANFFGIRGNSYITPKSTSILPSITNKSLMQLAEDMGMTVEVRQIPEDEIGTFDEAGACGTAAVISPIARIDDLDENKSYIFSKDGKPGPICEKLYNKLRAIQYGDEPDTHKWITIVE